MRALIKRLRNLVIVLLVVTFFTFILVDLMPGNPAAALLGDTATEEQIARVHDELGLDEPVVVRYVKWLGDVVTGDLGRSFRTSQPVIDALKQRIPVSIELMALAQLFALAAAVPLGIYTAYRPGRAVDSISRGAGFGMIAMPPFVLAMALILIFAVKLGWFPSSGFVRFSDGLFENLRSLVLPASTLAVAQVATYQQLLRADMMSTLQEDFILMAKAKGLPNWYILLRHALRPSSFSLITLAGVSIGRLIGGSVVVEVIFAIPGIGQLLIQSVYNRDFIVLQGALLFTAAAYVFVNLLVDVAYVLIDPRSRHARH